MVYSVLILVFYCYLLSLVFGMNTEALKKEMQLLQVACKRDMCVILVVILEFIVNKLCD